MKLPERFARRKGRGFHSAFATSFAVEFAAFEEVMLPQLSIGGASNVLLIADARMVTMGLSNGSALPETLGREYLLHSPPVADGLFHPKIVLQVGRSVGREVLRQLGQRHGCRPWRQRRGGRRDRMQRRA